MRKQALFSVVGIGVLGASIAFAQQAKQSEKHTHKHGEGHAHKHSSPAGQPAMEMPEWMTPEMMQACGEAATPGAMHGWLADGTGVWHGRHTMWMEPGGEPMVSEVTSTVTSMMDGRFTKVEVAGDMPGMGPYKGFGLYGFDNVSQQFQGTWCDSFGTGMMNGTGKLSSDEKELTWSYTFNCPITDGPKTWREVQRRTGKDTMVMEMYATPPIGGDEYKMIQIMFTRTGPVATADK